MLSPDDGSRRWWACTRKRKYSTEALALQNAQHRRERRRENLEPYRCQLCGCWHLATVKPARKRA